MPLCITVCSAYPETEGPEQAIDNNDNSSFLCFRTPASLVMVFSMPSTVSAYNLRTANNVSSRDPSSWRLDCTATADGAVHHLASVVGPTSWTYVTMMCYEIVF